MIESTLTMLLNLRDFFNHHIIFTLGILLFTGYFLGKLSQKIKLPSITGYIIAGLLLSDSVTRIVRHEIGVSLTNITEIALGLFALTIGGEITMNNIRKIGNRVITIKIFEGIFAFIFITIGLTVAGINFKFALLLGSIVVATAPAATTIIVRELRVRGKIIDFLKKRSDAGQTIMTVINGREITPVVEEIEEIMGDMDIYSGVMIFALDISFSKGSLEIL